MATHILQVKVGNRIARNRIFASFDVPVDGTIIRTRYDSDSLCVIGAVFDLLVNGSSIYPTFGDRPLMDDGEVFVETVESTPVVAGDRITQSAYLVGSFASVGQSLYANIYVDDGISGDIPPGGTVGQVLTKYDVADGAADWENIPAAGTLDSLSDVTITGVANDDIVQRKAGVWVNRTIAQLIADLGLGDAMKFKGSTDCSTNPNYPAADAGDTYRVSVAGRIGGAAGPKVEFKELFICIADGTAAGDHATVGANWVIEQANIDGAVVGPASATDSNAASFDGTSGKLIKDSGKALPTGVILGTSDTQTLTNKRVTARVGTTASSATPTPDADANDEYTVTALAVNATFGAPTGTPTDGQPMIIRIKDAGTAKTLAYNAIYRAVGVTLPTTTVISKTVYLGLIYNAADTKWDVVGVNQEA